MADVCPRLIEVALPIKEISAEAVRDKSLRHGHLTTLHMWFAWRPLAASRAVVFSSLVPDPDDERCPQSFKAKVQELLKDKVPPELHAYYRGRVQTWDADPYLPYEGIPDTLRNRLLMFIAKWSPESLAYQKGKFETPPKSQFLLDDRSLVKWETGDAANGQGRAILRVAHQLIAAAYDGKTPTVLDPFSGRGSIPLEASRLGCNSIANDYSPVAYLILKAGCEYPQKYGRDPKEKPRSITDNRKARNPLAEDFEYWANKMVEKAEEKLAKFYPRGKDKRPVIAYIWHRTAPCANPACRAIMPLVRSLVVCNKSNKVISLQLEVDNSQKTFSFAVQAANNTQHAEGTMQNRGNVKCPFCEQITPVQALREAGLSGAMGEHLSAVIVEGADGKDYRGVEEADLAAFEASHKVHASPPTEFILPEINSTDDEESISNSTGIRVHLYGMKTWGSLFNHRQLVMLEGFIDALKQTVAEIGATNSDKTYQQALAVYLGLLISRIAQRASNVGIWHTSRETLEHPFGRQAIPMTWDYPEANPFSEATGGVRGAIDWIKRIIIREAGQGAPCRILNGDAANLGLGEGSVDVVVTDPPYFDAIAYADLSDYFYVWFKRSLGEYLPELFSTPLTPKGEEATALKHRHNGSEKEAEDHFKNKLAQALSEAKRTMRPDGIISIMFAHQSTKAWTALISAVLEAGLTIDGTWAIDTELTTALKASMSALSSSITVACRPREASEVGSFKVIRKQIAEAVQQAVKRFWQYGLRGADLIVACYGPAVSVFGRYEKVEKADGSAVEVAELLDLARQAARDAIAGEFQGDSISSLYYVWANLYGSSEQSWDDARLVVQIGSGAESAIDVARRYGIFVVSGSTCRLALLADRQNIKKLNRNQEAPSIDLLHYALFLWQAEKRVELVSFLSERNLFDDLPFWNLAQALFEVLPHGAEDWKLINALLGEKPTLIAQARIAGAEAQPQTNQIAMDFGGQKL